MIDFDEMKEKAIAQFDDDIFDLKKYISERDEISDLFNAIVDLRSLKSSRKFDCLDILCHHADKLSFLKRFNVVLDGNNYIDFPNETLLLMSEIEYNIEDDGYLDVIKVDLIDDIKSTVKEKLGENKIMKCYTSCFSNLALLSKILTEVIPISICGKAPDDYKGLQYRKLAPKWSFFKEWKENHDNDFYIRNFNSFVLEKMNQEDVWNELCKISEGKPFALICYEKPDEFCHRHLVAEWLRKCGYEICEFTEGDEK